MRRVERRNWKRMGLLVALAGISLGLTVSCKKAMPKALAENELLDGPVEGLDHAQQARHLRGDRAFNDRVFTADDGLGSLFVANSCGSCHAGDGKGHPFTALVRFGQKDSSGNQFLAQGGPQLQNRALPGFQPERIPAGASASRFLPPANTGLGFIELVSDADILAMSDPADVDGDGISGVPNWMPLKPYLAPHAGAVSRGERYIHRFGKKASAYSLLQQTAGAYNQDMGVTSSYEPLDVYTLKAIDPEVTSAEIDDVVFYLQTLKAPLQRNQDDPQVIRGHRVFKEAGCAACHRETLHSGPSPVAALSDQDFHPYTDLLLHDMGPALNDGYTEGSALPQEWRTPALWGLGLSPASQGGQYYLMHDGRAHSIAEAIELHDGEGQASKRNYDALGEADRAALIRFLESL